MRCSRCGAQIGNSYVRFNGVLLCEDCARELKVDEVFRRQNSLFDQAFPMLGDFPGVFSSGSDLDFANAKIRCPRCGTTLRELESGGQLGCIECYNTFNESILKDILKRQGSSEYMGRKPGEAANIKVNTKAEAAPSEDKQETADTAPAKEETKQPETKQEDILEKVKDADLSGFTDLELEDAMKKAAAAEDYALAVKLRDELKSRKEGN